MNNFIYKAFCMALLTSMIVACGPGSENQRKHGNGKVPDGKLLNPLAPEGLEGQKSLDQGAEVSSGSDNEVVGEFRGYRASNLLINERFFKSNDSIRLDLYLEEVPGFFSPLSDQLGVYTDDGLSTGIKNAMPNGLNMLLWYLAIDGFAQELASACASPLAHPIFQQSDIRPEVQSALRAVCNWPDSAAHTEANLRAIWEIGMKADAPEAEFIAWRDYILGPSFTEKSGEAVHSMISTMLYNPHFLLKK